MTYEVTAESLWATVKAQGKVSVSADRRPLIREVRRLAAVEGYRVSTSTSYPPGMRSFGEHHGTIDILLRSES